MSPTRNLPRSHTWLRGLVLLLALLVPGTHAEMHAMPVAVASVETTVEYDVLDTAAALRPASPLVHRPTAPLRPAPVPAARAPRVRSFPAPPSPPYTLRALRTVVLRC
ncbi:hypothetical protein [Streptomyces sp. NPDC050538]|uniref:hypothetical protein n=1 Tax=Streptomyces sp. NPDC050538 TaxID=3365627 RepID=UPI0037B39556